MKTLFCPSISPQQQIKKKISLGVPLHYPVIYFCCARHVQPSFSPVYMVSYSCRGKDSKLLSQLPLLAPAGSAHTLCLRVSPRHKRRHSRDMVNSHPVGRRDSDLEDLWKSWRIISESPPEGEEAVSVTFDSHLSLAEPSRLRGLCLSSCSPGEAGELALVWDICSITEHCGKKVLFLERRAAECFKIMQKTNKIITERFFCGHW